MRSPNRFYADFFLPSSSLTSSNSASTSLSSRRSNVSMISPRVTAVMASNDEGALGAVELADAAAHGLVAVIVDDLHFADDASIDLLQSLVEH